VSKRDDVTAENVSVGVPGLNDAPGATVRPPVTPSTNPVASPIVYQSNN